MIKTIYPSKTATLIEATGSKNTGIDEILEISKQTSESAAITYNTRAVLQFDTSTISASLSSQAIHTASASGSLKYYLCMYVSEEANVPLDFSLVTHPLREAWNMGTGRVSNKPYSTNGCSWTYRTDKDSGDEWTDAGGYFHTGSHASQSVVQSFSNVAADIEMDVTDIVEAWHNGTLTNNGFIVKRSGSQETNSDIYGSLFYYSRNTNTIYPPRLKVKYDDATHTGFTALSGSVVTSDDDIIITPRLQPEYKQGSIERVIVDVQNRYGARSQAGSVGAPMRNILPQSSSYAIIDHNTGEVVYDHDSTYTYIGRKNYNVNYFDIDTNGLFPERFYKIQFKVNYYSGSVVIAERYHNIPEIFKVVR